MKKEKTHFSWIQLRQLFCLVWLLAGASFAAAQGELYIVAAPQVFCSDNNDVENNCPAATAVQFIVVNDCITEGVQVKVWLDLYNDGTIDADTETRDSNGEHTLRTNFDATITNSFPDFTIAGANFPVGTHVFNVQVEDECGSLARETILFTVMDCVAPIVSPVLGKNVSLLPVTPTRDVDDDGILDEGAIKLQAADFVDPAAYESCGGMVVSAIYAANDPRLSQVNFAPDPAHTSLMLTCQDFQPLSNSDFYFGIAPLRIYLIELPDFAGDTINNFAFIETYALATRDANISCTILSRASVSGIIRMPHGAPLAGVSLTLIGQTYATGATDQNGRYELQALSTPMPSTITPAFAGNIAEGVSTYDIILIRKHILGMTPLNDPYKMIAADVNNSKSITTLDIIEIRKVILGMASSFSSGKSWRFIDAAYQFLQGTNAWTANFPEYISMNSLVTNSTNADFMAIKLGDVNFNARISTFSEIEPRAQDLFYMKVNNEFLQSGSTYTIDLRAQDLAKLQGYQATLAFDKNALELIDWKGGIMQAEHIGLQQFSEGFVTISWDNATPDANYAAEEVLLTLAVKAKKNTQVADALTISERFVPAEAYDEAGHLQKIMLAFENNHEADFQMQQNFPNPFVGETTIRFYLPQASETTLLVHDVMGKQVLRREAYYPAGYNDIRLNSNDLPSGLLFYTIQSNMFSATKKMIVGE